MQHTLNVFLSGTLDVSWAHLHALTLQDHILRKNKLLDDETDYHLKKQLILCMGYYLRTAVTDQERKKVAGTMYPKHSCQYMPAKIIETPTFDQLIGWQGFCFLYQWIERVALWNKTVELRSIRASAKARNKGIVMCKKGKAFG